MDYREPRGLSIDPPWRPAVRSGSGMEETMRVWKFTGAALLLSAPVFAQDEMARRQAVEVMARVPFEKAMKGAPYSAETVVESNQTLPDGNRLTRKTTRQGL